MWDTPLPTPPQISPSSNIHYYIFILVSYWVYTVCDMYKTNNNESSIEYCYAIVSMFFIKQIHPMYRIQSNTIGNNNKEYCTS